MLIDDIHNSINNTELFQLCLKYPIQFSVNWISTKEDIKLYGDPGKHWAHGFITVQFENNDRMLYYTDDILVDTVRGVLLHYLKNLTKKCFDKSTRNVNTTQIDWTE